MLSQTIEVFLFLSSNLLFTAASLINGWQLIDSTLLIDARHANALLPFQYYDNSPDTKPTDQPFHWTKSVFRAPAPWSNSSND
jgi:hypothetical protein